MSPKTALTALLVSMSLFFGTILLLCILSGCQNGSQPCDPGDCDGCGPEDCGPVVRIIAITADWCPQCQTDKPALESAAASGLRITMKDFDVHEEEARGLGITMLPTYIVYVDNWPNPPSEMFRTLSVDAAIGQARKLEQSL